MNQLADRSELNNLNNNGAIFQRLYGDRPVGTGHVEALDSIYEEERQVTGQLVGLVNQDGRQLQETLTQDVTLAAQLRRTYDLFSEFRLQLNEDRIKVLDEITKIYERMSKHQEDLIQQVENGVSSATQTSWLPTYILLGLGFVTLFGCGFFA